MTAAADGPPASAAPEDGGDGGDGDGDGRADRSRRPSSANGTRHVGTGVDTNQGSRVNGDPPTAPVAAGGTEADVDAAVETLYRRDLTRIVRLAYLLTGDRPFAEEAGQEAFARLLPRYASTREPSGFLTTVTVNLCRDRGRRRATAARHPMIPAPPTGPPGLPRETDEVWRSVQALPERRRQVVILRYWADCSTDEIARLTGVRPGTVRSSLTRALASLQEVLPDDR